MTARFEHVGMAVADLDRCLAFYCGLLGLELRLRRRTPGGEVAFVSAGGAELEIVCSAKGASMARPPEIGAAGVRHITFMVGDVDATYARLEAAGVRTDQPPRDAFNRDVFSRVAFVFDPDGIVVELAQPPDGG